MSTEIQIRRDTAANWTAANPTLAQGEPALETDTKKQKIGDGTTAWTSLPYSFDSTSTDLQKTNNLSDVADAGTSRANLHVPTLVGSAAVATTNQSSLTGNPTIDGYALAAGDIVLLTGQSTASQNGQWLLPTGGGTWTRPTDFTSATTVKGRQTFVINGTSNSNTVWILDAPTAGIVIDTAAQTWTKLASGGTGNMNTSTYDPAAIAQQVVGTTATQTLTNKTLTSPTISGPTLSGTIAGTYTIGGTPTFPAAVVQLTATQTLSNKRLARRIGSTTSSATPAINTDNYDIYEITALATGITGFTMSGTPVDGDLLMIRITDSGTLQSITWGSSFEASGNVALPTGTVASTLLTVGFAWNTVTSKWRCIAVA